MSIRERIWHRMLPDVQAAFLAGDDDKVKRLLRNSKEEIRKALYDQVVCVRGVIFWNFGIVHRSPKSHGRSMYRHVLSMEGRQSDINNILSDRVYDSGVIVTGKQTT